MPALRNFKPFFVNSNLSIGNIRCTDADELLRDAAGNTGNSYITYSLIKSTLGDLSGISHIPNIYEYDFKNADRDAEKVKGECTHVFLILQDQIRIEESYNLKLPYEGIISLLKKCGKPVVVAGLGANSFSGFDPNFHKMLNPRLVRFLGELSDLCPNIGIRGEFTSEVLKKLGIRNTQVIGCPSFFETGPNRVVKKPDFKNIKPVLTSPLASTAENLPAVMQDLMERDIINLSVFGIIPQRYRKCDYKRALRGDLGIFLNPEKWKAFLRRFNFALGPRLHGSIAAINAGLPALCTNADSRATEMCKFLKIPHALADLRNYENPITPAEFPSHLKKAYEACDIDAMNAAYPALFENYKNFIESHGIALKSGECMNADMLTDVKMCGKVELSLRRIINKISNSVKKRLKLPGIKKTP